MKQSDLKLLRMKKRMTQQQFADALGIGLRSYRAYENLERTAGRDVMSALWGIVNTEKL